MPTAAASGRQVRTCCCAPFPDLDAIYHYPFIIVGLSYLTVRADQRQQVVAGVLANLPRLTKASPTSDYLLWKTYLGIFEHYFEKLVNTYPPTSRLEHYLSEQIEIRNEDWLIRAYRRHNGLLMVSGHFGAVEYLPLFLALKGYVRRFPEQWYQWRFVARELTAYEQQYL